MLGRIVKATGSVTYDTPAAASGEPAATDRPARRYSLLETYWTIDKWIPPEHAIGGVSYWTPLLNKDGTAYYRFDVEEDVWDVLPKLEKQGQEVRVVKVTREVVE
jgi:hypothetical protein